MSDQVQLKEKGWDTESLKETIATAPKGAVQTALIQLFYNQTDDERVISRSKIVNKKGFNKQDAGIGCDMAKQVLAGTPLTDEQLLKARQLVPKYHRQIGAVVVDATVQN